MELIESINQIFSVKGKKVAHLNIKKDRPTDEEIQKLLLGPTGNLRAPTLRVGKTLLVGFNSDTYQDVFDV